MVSSLIVFVFYDCKGKKNNRNQQIISQKIAQYRSFPPHNALIIILPSSLCVFSSIPLHLYRRKDGHYFSIIGSI
jgi:hypothetical protein